MSNEDVKAVAAEVHEILQGLAEKLFTPSDTSDDDVPNGGVLTGWYLVCEWLGNDGEAWITYWCKPDQAVWRSRGLLEEAVTDL